MTTIPQLSQTLQKLLITDAKKLGRASGFIQRERKLNGATFAQSLIFGWQANPNASLEELCQSARVCGVEISPQGLQERLNSPQAHAFLYQLLMKALSYVVEAEGERRDLLARFNGVYIQDSSKIELPAPINDRWPGNKVGEASLKVHVLWDYQQGYLNMTLVSGRRHDCPLQTIDLPAGSLRLADVGYFKVKVFEHLNRRGAHWVSRLPSQVGIWQDDHVGHLAIWLKDQQTDCIDQWVEISAQRLKCRLIAVRVPPDVAAQRRKRTQTDARVRLRGYVKKETLALCDWTIIITNLDATCLTISEALCLLRLRWQIELLFKLWKDELSLDDWRSKHPLRILSEVYAKLLLALIQHWLLVMGCWDIHNRSLVKASRALRKQAFHILCVLPDFELLCRSLSLILPTLARCTIQKRKARPATFQLLSRASP